LDVFERCEVASFGWRREVSEKQYSFGGEGLTDGQIHGLLQDRQQDRAARPFEHIDEGTDMANPDHLARLRSDVDAWNQWHRNDRGLVDPVDLTDAELAEAFLVYTNLRGVDLSRANLTRARLQGANLSGADLSGANLSGAKLQEANLRGANLEGANLDGADLWGASLGVSGFSESATNLSNASLRGASLYRVDFSNANLSGADLSGAQLVAANLRAADLSNAILEGANLQRAILIETELQSASLVNSNLKGAVLVGSVFGFGLQDADVSGAEIGRDTVIAHLDLSSTLNVNSVKFVSDDSEFDVRVGLDTVYLSKATISEEFLRNARVPDALITLLRDGGLLA
jgi:uncharacterized protein YjbI with pentapeptide repeats